MAMEQNYDPKRLNQMLGEMQQNEDAKKQPPMANQE